MASESRCKSESSICLLEVLPAEILRRVLSEFSDGRTLSTLALALSTSSLCDFYQRLAWKIIPAITHDRLSEISLRLKKHVKDDRDGTCLQGVVDWIQSVHSAEPQYGSVVPASNDVAATLCSRMKTLSEDLALVDFLEHSLLNFCGEEKGRFEWPVWCGQLTIDLMPSSVTGSRLRSTARVVITSPMQRPSMIPGSGLIKNRTPCGVFQSEHYNLLPVPPWGQVHGLKAEDRRLLLPVAKRLLDLGQVAVPAGYQNSELLDVRIVTKKQAKRNPFGIRRPTSWMLDMDADSELICCWHDDSDELSDDREYLDFIIDLMEAHARLCKSSEP